MSVIVGSWTEDRDQELDVLTKKGVTRTEAEHARFGLLHGFKSEFRKHGKLHTPWKEEEPMTSPLQWTKIDPAVHTPEWFRGKTATFIQPSCNGRYLHVVDKDRDYHPKFVAGATHFLLHPPLPDPLAQELEDAANDYANSVVTNGYDPVFEAYLAGARAWMGKGKA